MSKLGQKLLKAMKETNNSLGCCKPAAVPPNAYLVSTGCSTAMTTTGWCEETLNIPCNQEETESVMEARVQVTTTEDTVADQRRFLTRRLQDIECEKRNVARKAFGVGDDGRPTTWPELVDAIKAGQYVYDEKRAEEEYEDWMGPFTFVKFRDPSVKTDKKGYAAWEANMYKASQVVKDEIKILDPAVALESVRKFEAAEIN